ncbi:hypothetical protein I79_004020 [Cricetulus griseus]|uniref:Uncharacterized protein n=1 Tax=Cricetulus griseus TaxID=10029 RepID=G3H1J2_CRIGR|nr:hypothetical protein I79_004020 [Cricetulus griseus]
MQQACEEEFKSSNKATSQCVCTLMRDIETTSLPKLGDSKTICFPLPLRHDTELEAPQLCGECMLQEECCV